MRCKKRRISSARHGAGRVRKHHIKKATAVDTDAAAPSKNNTNNTPLGAGANNTHLQLHNPGQRRGDRHTLQPVQWTAQPRRPAARSCHSRADRAATDTRQCTPMRGCSVSIQTRWERRRPVGMCALQRSPTHGASPMPPHTRRTPVIPQTTHITLHTNKHQRPTSTAHKATATLEQRRHGWSKTHHDAGGGRRAAATAPRVGRGGARRRGGPSGHTS